MVTVIWATVGSWEIFQGTRGTELPSWDWHNSHFVTAVTVVFCLTVCLWPSIIIHIIHAMHGNFFELVIEIDAHNSGLLGILAFHLISFPVVFIANIVCI